MLWFRRHDELPQTPTPHAELLEQSSPERLFQIVSTVSEPTVAGKYLHWDDLRHREPPEGLTLSEWWLGLKLRSHADKSIPLWI